MSLVQCSQCGQQLQLNGPPGTMVACPGCQAQFMIPVADNRAAPPMAANPYNPPLAQQQPRADRPAPSLALMTIPLYISSAIYAMLGVVIPIFFMSIPDAPPMFGLLFGGMMALFCFALAGFIVFFTGQLPKRKKWAWITAIVFGAMYAPSLFIFMGIPILMGCFKQDVMSWFNDA